MCVFSEDGDKLDGNMFKSQGKPIGGEDSVFPSTGRHSANSIWMSTGLRTLVSPKPFRPERETSLGGGIGTTVDHRHTIRCPVPQCRETNKYTKLIKIKM